MQKAEGQYPRQSSAERKEALYQDIIDYFDKGKVSFVITSEEVARGLWGYESLLLQT